MLRPLKRVFANYYGKFNDIEREMLKKMFDSPQCSINDIEEYLRMKFGKGYDKKVKRGLDQFYKESREFDKEFGHIFKIDK